MGNAGSIQNIANFEDVQRFVSSDEHIIINVMEQADQDILIAKTLSADKEADVINSKIDDGDFDCKILVYGRNNSDFEKVLGKQRKLMSYGFTEVYVYLGGLFEWVLLQDIYGAVLFKTTRQVSDILRYKK
jgi:rhodanese-related sulfurtransferase